MIFKILSMLFIIFLSLLLAYPAMLVLKASLFIFIILIEIIALVFEDFFEYLFYYRNPIMIEIIFFILLHILHII